MFYIFIVLFKKSSTLTDLVDLCIIKKKGSKPSLTSWGRYNKGREGKRKKEWESGAREVLKACHCAVVFLPLEDKISPIANNSPTHGIG